MNFFINYTKSYTESGLLAMVDRNRKLKNCPEKFQECQDEFKIIFTVEERIYDIVMEGTSQLIFFDFLF